LRGGYRALFYGPPGTGKTLAAALLGKHCGRDVYRIALSAVVSKYIGETEKNLERVFVRAERLNCILFFDEADALFGRRTGVGNAHDRYANQEVSYLLQRVEDYRGLIILATNLESNIDEAFLRRFHAIVHFPMPGPAERLRLWRESLPPACAFEAGIDIEAIAADAELSGGAILNVVQYAALMALDAGCAVPRREDLRAGIRRELQKEGRTT
jgi:SpoVK/Ycf46/Vps4 family AAA+-type ATPase